MAGNTSLGKAKDAKEDEFYTQRKDIENELQHYKPFFENKVVYCNCDDPKESEFWQFFVRVFNDWKLKKLIATHYETDKKNFSYKLELIEDTNGDGKIDWNDEPKITPLPCNGDFRSAACVEILKEADIIVTNPPFSLFREYITQLLKYKKKFLVIGSQNNITYKEIFPLLKEDKLWLGYFSGEMAFKVPEYYQPRKTRYWQDETGQKWRSMGNICWYTNLDIKKRHEQLDLRGNYYQENNFYHYINYDAINIDKVADIPCDYEGAMGVPITFMQKYSPDQFEILGLDGGNLGTDYGISANLTPSQCEQLFHECKGFRKGKLCYRDETGKLQMVYRRVLIRNRYPEKRRCFDEDSDD